MKTLLTAVFLMLFASSLYADVYTEGSCEAQCKVLIDFPDGGSLHAVEALTITFGNNGLMDTIGGSIAYAKDDSLTLNAGESITFAAGGVFNIGDAGNIIYTNIEITTEGTVDFIAVGGTETITIGNITITNAAAASFSGKILKGTGIATFSNVGLLKLNDLTAENVNGTWEQVPTDNDDPCSNGDDDAIVISSIPNTTNIVTWCDITITNGHTIDLQSAGKISIISDTSNDSTDPTTNSDKSGGAIGFLHALIMLLLYPFFMLRKLPA